MRDGVRVVLAVVVVLAATVAGVPATATTAAATGTNQHAPSEVITACYKWGDQPGGKTVGLTVKVIVDDLKSDGKQVDEKTVKEIRKQVKRAVDSLKERDAGASIPVRVDGKLYVVDWIICHDGDGVPPGRTVDDGQDDAGDNAPGEDVRERLQNHERGHAYVYQYLWQILNCIDERTGINPWGNWWKLVTKANKNYHQEVGKSVGSGKPSSEQAARKAARKAVKKVIKEQYGGNVNAEGCFPPWFSFAPTGSDPKLATVAPGVATHAPESADESASDEPLVFRLADALATISGEDVPGSGKRVAANERINVHVGDGTVGVLTDENAVPQFVTVGGVEDPTLRVEMSTATAVGIVDADDPAREIDEGVRSGEIRYHGVGLSNRVKWGIVDLGRGIASGIGDLASGF